MEKFASFIFRKWVSTALVAIGFVAFGIGFKCAWASVESVDYLVFEEGVIGALDSDGGILFREFLPRGAAGTPFMVHWKRGRADDLQVGGMDGDGTRFTVEGSRGRFMVDVLLDGDRVVFYRVHCSGDAREEARALHQKLKERLPGVWSKFGLQAT